MVVKILEIYEEKLSKDFLKNWENKVKEGGEYAQINEPIYRKDVKKRVYQLTKAGFKVKLGYKGGHPFQPITDEKELFEKSNFILLEKEK